MTVPVVVAPGFYLRTDSGDLCCRVCLGLRGEHSPRCAVIALRLRTPGDERAGSALYVAEVRETLDAVEHLIHGEETQS